MDFIGNLLNQMSSAFNQETAIPKKEEISMDETLKWRALKNNQFASRTRGGVAAATVTGTGATGSAVVVAAAATSSSIGRRSSGRGTSNGQRKQQQQRTSSSENSNDSTGGADGLLSGLEEDGSSCSALLAANGTGDDDPEEDIEIEIAKDISGEELQEALGLSQLVEVEPMDIGGTMVEGQPVGGQAPPEEEQLTVEKREPTGSQASPDEENSLPRDSDRKLDAGFEPLKEREDESSAKNSTSTNDPATEDQKMEIKEKKSEGETQPEPTGVAAANDREAALDDRDEKVPPNGPPEGSATSASKIEPTPTAPDQTDDRVTEEAKKISTIEEGEIAGLKGEEATTATTVPDLGEDDDDDVLIISTDDMTDVVEVAETSKEDEDDEDEDEKEETKEDVGATEQKHDDHAGSLPAFPGEPVVNKQAPDVDPVALPKARDTAAKVDEAEEKYDPTQPRDAGEKHVDDCSAVVEPVEAKFSSTLAAANGQETDGNSPTEPKPTVEEKPPKEKEDPVAIDANALGSGRTTRSKKAASVVVVAAENTSTSTPSQRRSQRFQGKEPLAAAGGRKSTDLKLNGNETQSDGAIVVVKEEEPDEGMARKKTIVAGGATATAKAPTKAAAAGLSSSERSASVVSKSDRSLRSRQQSTSSSGPVGSGPVMVTRRSSETVKSVGLEDSNDAIADTAGVDRSLNRRGRKRLSQDPTPMEATPSVVVSSREKAARETTPTKEEPTTVGGDLGFPVDPGENDSGGKQQQEHEQEQQQEQQQEQEQEPKQTPEVTVVAASTVQRRGRKRKPQNLPETSGAAASFSGLPEKPPPYKRAARVSRDGSDGILASALARRDKVDPQGRLSRPIKLSAKMLANEELRHGFEQHNNSRIIIGSDSATQGHDEPQSVVEREKDRDRTDAGGSEKSRRQQQQQQQQQQEIQAHKEVNLPPANSAISSSSEDVMVVSVTYPTGKGPTKGSQYPVGKDTPSAGRKQTEASTSDRQRAPSGKPVSSGTVSKRPGGPSAPSICPDVQTFLQEIRASRICKNRSPEENRKLNRRQTKRLAKLKEKHLLALGLQRKGANTQQQQHPVRNGARKSSAEVDDGLLLSEAEPESESSGSEADFVPSQKIGTVGKPSVTLRLRKPETLLESSPVNVSPASSSKQQQQQQQRQQQHQPPLVTVPSAMVNRGSVGRQPVPVSRQQQQQQQQGGSSKQQQHENNGRMGANSRRSSSSVVLPASMTTASASSSVSRKDQETEELQRSLERFGCELTLIPTSTNSTGTPPSSEGPSSSSSATHNSTNRKRAKEPTTQQQRSLVRPNHHHPPPPYRSQAAASPSSSSALASTSPSLHIVLEKRPPSVSSSSGHRKISSTSTPGGSMGSPPSAAGARPLLCLCRQTSDIYVASSAGTGYCTAVDDIDGQRIGCCNELAEELVHMLRPSPTVSFQLLCNLHRKRLEDHSCCAICGVFCTQGNFAMCKNAHIFHPDCAVKYILNAPYDPSRPGDHTAPTLVLQCPHCGQECPNGEIQVTVQLTTPPVLLPSRKNIVKPAKMAIAKSKSSRNGGSTAKDAFRANVDAFVPSSVRSVLAASGPTNGHDPKRSSPMAAGGSGTGTRSHFTTKQIFEAIHKDNVDRITEIIISGFDIETRFRDFHDGTCLHLVSNFGSIGMAYLIICRAQSVDFLNILDRELRTALMCAVLGEKIDIIKLLLDCGADVTVKGPDGMTVLHLAAKLGQQEAVRVILESARKRLTARDMLAFVNGVDCGSYTALVWAAENRHKETIQLLLEVGADVNICDKENNTSLHWAAMAGCSETMHLLVKNGCDPNVQNINGDTPLHLACRHENGTICILLLTMGASLNVRNASNELPQDMLRNPNSECANIIAANVKMSGLGKNTKETRILCSDISNGREYYPVQVVHVAGRNDRHQTMPKFKYIRKSVQIEGGIDINMCDMVVCSCKDSCTSADSSCLCSERTWYTGDGRLVSDFDFLEPPTIVECGELCDCNQLLCRNRVVQQGLRIPLQLFYSPGKAWGVRTLVPIPKGTFLVEYVGELLPDEVANQRPDDTYFFDLNSGFCIDANAYGNISRFFNHSCDPNVSPVSVYYEHQDKRFPKVAMFACRDIKAHEEICFNYGEKFWMVKNRTMSCLCNASECRYRTVQQGVLL
uniref:Histone-lysine N-methyltransferase n=1 Tax=Anopheles atroparvus TaxID=41427 RepID=A0AAG5CT98_ANOAO